MIIGVLASGRGSNFAALLHRIEEDGIPATIAAVISNNEQAGVLQLAKENNIPGYYIERSQFETGSEFCQALEAIFDKHGINFLVLAGYLKKIPPRIIQRFAGRILNIHPALLPDFGGKGMYGHAVHEAVLKSGSTVSGATVHLVDEEYDHGPIVLQREVPVLEGDTPDILAARVLQIEHRIYAEAVRLFAEGRVKVEGRKVRILDHSE